MKKFWYLPVLISSVFSVPHPRFEEPLAYHQQRQIFDGLRKEYLPRLDNVKNDVMGGMNGKIKDKYDSFDGFDFNNDDGNDGDDDWKIGTTPAKEADKMEEEEDELKEAPTFEELIKEIPKERPQTAEEKIFDGIPDKEYTSVRVYGDDYMKPPITFEDLVKDAVEGNSKYGQKIIKVPYPLNELPNKGVDFPTPLTNQYDRADYIEKFHLKNIPLRRFNPFTNSFAGAGKAAWAGIKGLYNVVRHPIRTAKALAWAARHPGITAKAIGRKFKDNTRIKGLANTIGATGFEIGTFFTPAGVGKLVGKFGSTLGKMTTKAGKEGGKAAKVGVAIETTGQVADGLGQIANAHEYAEMGYKYHKAELLRQKLAELKEKRGMKMEEELPIDV